MSTVDVRPAVATAGEVGSARDSLARIVTSHALAATGMSLPWPFLLAQTWTVSGDEALLGAAGAARMVPYVLFSWWVARLADRHGRGRVVVLSLWFRLALLIGAAAALAGSGAPATMLTVAVGLCALAVAAGTPAYPALVAALPSVASSADLAPRQRATSLLVTVEVASFVVGPALGGLLLGHVAGWTVPLLGAALTGLARWLLTPVRLDGPGAGASSALADPALLSSAAASKPLPEVASIPRLVLRTMRVRGAIAAICVVNLVASGLLVALVPLAQGRWGTATDGYGLATAGFGFGALAGPALWWLGRTPVRRVHLGMVAFATTLVALVGPTGLAPTIVVLVIAGAVAVHVEAAATEVLQDAVPEHVRAGVLGTTDALMVAAAMIGSFVGPIALGLLGAGRLLVALAAFTIVAGLVALPVVRDGLDPVSPTLPG